MRSLAHVAIASASVAALVLSCSRNQGRDGATKADLEDPAPDSPARTTFGPTVAGRFYPSDRFELETLVRSYLAAGARSPSSLRPDQRVVGIIAPHAGYVYSGAVAGRAYAAASKTGSVRTVVILGPSHHRARSAAATVSPDAYRTPIGDVPIAQELVARLLRDGVGLVEIAPDVLLPEHSVDVQLPFVKLAFPSARVVPIVVPALSPERLDALAGLLFQLLSGDHNALVVASTDLSHFFDHATAEQVDRQIEEEIVAGDVAALTARHDERRGPCGVASIAVALAYLKRFGPTGRTIPLERINSGDTTEGDKSRVVGYLAAALTVGP